MSAPGPKKELYQKYGMRRADRDATTVNRNEKEKL
jgi:hypothetical protein